MPMQFDRRRVLAAMAAILAARPALASDGPLELEWDDLLPPESKGLLMDALQGLGVVEHGTFSSPFDQEKARAVVTEFNGKRVRIPGYAVPLDFEGTAIKTFILVPYVGACIHVPPPPANQLVYVKPTEPFESESMWDPIFATGMFATTAVATELAEIGYIMQEASVEPYA